MIITHCSKPNFDRQKPTLGKMYETNSDGYLNFFLNCQKYLRLKSFWEILPILNHGAPTFFINICDPLSKLAATVEVRSFDGILLHRSFLYPVRGGQWRKSTSYREGSWYRNLDAASRPILRSKQALYIYFSLWPGILEIETPAAHEHKFWVYLIGPKQKCSWWPSPIKFLFEKKRDGRIYVLLWLMTIVLDAPKSVNSLRILEYDLFKRFSIWQKVTTSI